MTTVKQPQRRLLTQWSVVVAVLMGVAVFQVSTVLAFWTSTPDFSQRCSAQSCKIQDKFLWPRTSRNNLWSLRNDISSSSWHKVWDGPKYNISLLLIDHYDSFTYNLYDYFAQLTLKPPTVIAKDAFDEWQDSWTDQYDGVVLSPGPGTPQEQPALSHQAISKNPDLPIFGVCLGHQLMALNYGARVEKAPTPIHGQDHWISQEEKESSSFASSSSSSSSSSSLLFDKLPSSFRVVRYHSLAAYDLPECLQVTARSKGDQVIQAMQHVQNPHFGVQFHPESIGTQHGMAIIENFCKIVESYKEKRMEGRLYQVVHESAVSGAVHDTCLDSSVPAKSRFRVMAYPFQASAQPVQVFEALYEGKSHVAWLDSSSAASSRGEIDILAAPSSSCDVLEYLSSESPSMDILTILEQELFGGDDLDGDRRRRPASQELALINQFSEPIVFDKDDELDTSTSLPFHYRGGYLGYLGYEVRHDTQRHLHQIWGGKTGNTPRRVLTDAATPTAAFFLARNSLVYHHPTSTWYMISLVESDQGIDEVLEWMKTTKGNILRLTDKRANEQETADVPMSSIDQARLPFIPNRSKETYEEDIAKCREFIRQGESYELCLTNQLEVHLPEPLSTWNLYKILRRGNPAPYSAYFQWKSERLEDLTICCSSPERFMSVQRKQPHPEVPMFLQAEAKPIKGTEARVVPQNGVCRTEAEDREDERRARSLELSLKNRAENLMIVDLLRNDMSRVCQVGSVHVAKLMAIESFATVHQMVSTIRGTLTTVAEDFGRTSTSIDLLRAAFPGGSMTGAPKIRTMELLEELEQGVDRGPYAGSLGYVSVNGCMDMNIIIRSAVITEGEDGQRVRIGAGGAITALSDAQDEYDEMLLKARAVVQSVQAWAAQPSVISLDTATCQQE